MDTISIGKRDVLWSYVAKFFNIATGFITLPIILSLLTTEEIALNYLMMTVASLVALIDFGFSPQFSRSITYIFSGVAKLQKEGMSSEVGGSINYHLLSVYLESAKFVYKRLAFVSLILLLTGGSYYIYVVTQGFTKVENSFYIWILFSISEYFNIYYSYYGTLLFGSGKVMESNKSAIYSKLVYLLICIPLLYLHVGLFSVVIASFISPFVSRFYAYCVFFTKELKSKLDSKISKEEIKETFSIIWYNAKKLGCGSLGGYALNRSTMFFVGLYLTLEEAATYGLLCQIVNIIFGMAQTLPATFSPKLSQYRVTRESKKLLSLLSVIVILFWMIMISGYIATITIAPYLLQLIGSHAVLPSLFIITIYFIQMTLEGNHGLFANCIVANNEVPFVKAALLSGFSSMILVAICLHSTNMGIFGVVFIPFVVQLVYNNWRWPYWILQEFNISIITFLRLGFTKLYFDTTHLASTYIKSNTK